VRRPAGFGFFPDSRAKAAPGLILAQPPRSESNEQLPESPFVASAGRPGGAAPAVRAAGPA